jgi:hypothetical protein
LPFIVSISCQDCGITAGICIANRLLNIYWYKLLWNKNNFTDKKKCQELYFYAKRSDIKAFLKSGVRSIVTADALPFFTMRHAVSTHGLSTMSILMR